MVLLHPTMQQAFASLGSSQQHGTANKTEANSEGTGRPCFARSIGTSTKPNCSWDRRDSHHGNTTPQSAGSQVHDSLSPASKEAECVMSEGGRCCPGIGFPSHSVLSTQRCLANDCSRNAWPWLPWPTASSAQLLLSTGYPKKTIPRQNTLGILSGKAMVLGDIYPTTMPKRL